MNSLQRNNKTYRICYSLRTGYTLAVTATIVGLIPNVLLRITCSLGGSAPSRRENSRTAVHARLALQYYLWTKADELVQWAQVAIKTQPPSPPSAAA